MTLIIRFCLLLTALSSVIAQADYCDIAKLALKEATRLRGLPLRSEVPCEVKDHESVRSYILNTIKEKLPQDRLKHEAIAYKSIGMIPQDYDYEKGIVEMYVSQIGGFYDPDKKRFVMAAWIPELMQMPVAVHELTHGLQDQHFDLNRFVDMKNSNSDQQMARAALVEGDATIIMLDYSRQQMGQGRLSSESSVDSIIMQSLIGASLGAGAGNVPESLRMLLLFPYTSGLRFAHSILKSGSYSRLDAVFSRGGPRSTEEVLHPEKYWQKQADFKEISDTDLVPSALPDHSGLVYSDTLGEFAISVLLATFASDRQESTAAAAGWAGDRLALFVKDARTCLIWQTLWDTEKDAAEFEAAFGASLLKRGLKSNASTKVELSRQAKNVNFNHCTQPEAAH